jgi:hypothetical protein
MKRLIPVLFGVLLLNINLSAQTNGIIESGRATQEMGGAGCFIAHSSLPIGDTIRVVNAITGEGIDAVVCARIEESPDRIIDVSYEVWDGLGLMEDDIVMLVSASPNSPSNSQAAAPLRTETVAETEYNPVDTPRERQTNEINRLKITRPIYHLLVLDRLYCAANSDISDLQNIKLLYKFKHGRKGYLVALYISYGEGPLFPVMPDKSRILVNLMASNKAFIRDYTNSPVFRRFVTSQRVISQLQRILSM